MPIYEYECPVCHKRCEHIEYSFKKQSPFKCATDNVELVKVISVPASPQFKGDGWTPRGSGGGCAE